MAKMSYENDRVIREADGVETVFSFDPPTDDEFVNQVFGYGLYNKASANKSNKMGSRENPMPEEDRMKVLVPEFNRLRDQRTLASEPSGEGRGGARAAQPLSEVTEVLTQFALNRGKPAALWTKAATLLGFCAEGVWIKAADQRERLEKLIEDNSEVAQAKADVEEAKKGDLGEL